jgi:lipoprotein-anchoring transpeptidase ErfK/SrfK
MKTIIATLILASLSTLYAVPNPKKPSETSKPHRTTPSAASKSNKAATPKSKGAATKPSQAPAKHAKQLTSQQQAFSNLTGDERLRLQVFLDRAQFAPGKVDGTVGEFTFKAATRWMQSRTERSLELLLTSAREMSVPTIITFVIPNEATKFIGDVPATLAEKATAKRLPYTSLAEYVTERFHTDIATLARLNAQTNLDTLKPGHSLRVPNVVPFLIESPKVDAVAKRLAGAQLHIQHTDHMLEVRDSDSHLVAAFPITVGNKSEHVRTGAWKVVSFAPNPTFKWDDNMLKNGIAGDKQYVLPPGPNSPVGVLWMELEPVKGPEAHIGIHGTNDPTHIGRNHSSGCIRLANWDIVRLARMVGPGARVAWIKVSANTLLASVPAGAP